MPGFQRDGWLSLTDLFAHIFKTCSGSTTGSPLLACPLVLAPFPHSSRPEHLPQSRAQCPCWLRFLLLLPAISPSWLNIHPEASILIQQRQKCVTGPCTQYRHGLRGCYSISRPLPQCPDYSPLTKKKNSLNHDDWPNLTNAADT